MKKFRDFIRLRIKSISITMSVLYLFLAIVNMSFFTIMIYENQIDLITENGKYRIKQQTEDFIAAIRKLSPDAAGGVIFYNKTREDVLRDVAATIKPRLSGDDSLIIFTEDGTVLYSSRPGLKLTGTDIRNGMTAITNLDYSGRALYSTIDEKSFVMKFYIPHRLNILGDCILLLKIEMRDFQERLWELYRMILFILVFLALFHVAFAIAFNRLFIRPIQALHEKSLEISRGNLSARAVFDREDEIGELAAAFNGMADSIQEKILTLQEQNDLMEQEMDVASGVQKLIFPSMTGDRNFTYASYWKSLTKVSGDYFDIVTLDKNRTGIIIIDVTGHGVPAALVTMVLKEVFNRAAPLYDDPAELICHLNTDIISLLSKNEIVMGVYFTGIYIIFDGKETLSYCNAGHDPGLLVNAKTGEITSLTRSGSPLGVIVEMNKSYKSETLPLGKGDRVYLYTDGIVECRNLSKKEFGLDGLIASIVKTRASSPQESVDTIVADIHEHIGSGRQRDDATLLLIEAR
ncbi:MAG: SpoIIE family protein phosphatase [Spirochaetes bacterium]|nr:SpoIIE family protein phosphatase [Spirochaetota bacterium]